MYVIRLPKKGDVVTALQDLTYQEPKEHRKGDTRPVQIVQGQRLKIVYGDNLLRRSGIVVLQVFKKDRNLSFGKPRHPRRKNIIMLARDFSEKFASKKAPQVVNESELRKAYKTHKKKRYHRMKHIELQ